MMKRPVPDRRPRCAPAAIAALAVLASFAPVVRAAEREVPPRPAGAPSDALTPLDKEALATWILSRPAVRAATAGRRTRVLRVWSDVAKGDSSGSDPEGVRSRTDLRYRRATLLLRDYDAGTAREITVELATGRTEMRVLVGVPPSAEEIEQGMRIVRRDPGLAPLVDDPKLTLMGGFSNRSSHADDPCARDICLEFAFMRPGYAKGPARYVVVNLTRGVVAHHDFRARPGESAPRMTQASPPQ